MPKIQRTGLPRELLRHIHERATEREISRESLEQVLFWVVSNPTVPDGQWFKRFDGVTLCGNGPLILTVLDPGMIAVGTEVS